MVWCGSVVLLNVSSVVNPCFGLDLGREYYKY